MSENSPQLSIVSTIYQDAHAVARLVEELITHTSVLDIPFEIILVNDCSTDGSEEEIKKVCLKYPFVKGISLARNYGQQIAVSAGIRFTKGNYVVLIDGDLENPVSSIPVLFRKIVEGYDLVYTVAKRRQTFLKQMTSGFFWFVICRLLKINIIRDQLLLRIMTKRTAEIYNQYGELSRSVAGINHDMGMKSTAIEVVPGMRYSGKSNYSFFKRLNMFIDIVLNLSLKPLNFVIFIGFFTFIFSVIISMYYLYIYFTVGTLPGYTSNILTLFFFGSVIVFTLGIMSRYLSLIYLEVRNRPLFLVRETFNL